MHPLAEVSAAEAAAAAFAAAATAAAAENSWRVGRGELVQGKHV